MKIKRVKKFNYDFSDTGVLSDLAFLLLIFFLAVGTFIPVWGYRMDTGGVKSVPSPECLEFELTESGLKMDGRRISTFMAGYRISNAVEKNCDAKITLLVAPEVEYQMVVDAIDILKKAGTRNLNLVAKSDRQAP